MISPNAACGILMTLAKVSINGEVWLVIVAIWGLVGITKSVIKFASKTAMAMIKNQTDCLKISYHKPVP